MTQDNQDLSLTLVNLPAEQENGMVEALLFVSGEPVPSERLAELLGKTVEETDLQLQEMAALWTNDTKRGCTLLPVANGWQMVTKPDYAKRLRYFLQSLNKPRKLSPTTLETLAIVAGKQPITRQEVELIRGVSADYAINQLLSLGLIDEVGKKPGAGRANLYATTDLFLSHFGLRSLDDLPEKLEFLGKGV